MNISRRRGAIATFITLGVLLCGLAITLNIGWIVLNEARLLYMILGIILFAVLVAGVVLNTIFLVREIRRNERQDSFLNAVTHELKTPIASIRLYLETLQRRSTTEEQKQEFYKIMHADSDRLLATVEQVLKAGELGQRIRQQNKTLIDIEPLVAECVATTLRRHRLSPEAVVLEPVPGAVKLRVVGVAEDLRIALLNLLDNAVKYSPDGVKVRVALSIADYSFVKIAVTDQGVGIPADQLKRIFNRFYRIPGRYSVKIKGTGIGLFLVRTIARQHGGKVTAASPGSRQGSTLSLELPLAGNDSALPEQNSGVHRIA
ncbi:His Kinase A (phospho-acceptor) domain-containing protein [Granulicella rosea]|uniref:histidine kinase n=1 Tax=Granulicella rosea TaxID=474952 RepID=A0A239ISK4_9BACT|nr:HAMP domain-containing sensor histidine kinase [Granulicella rosea]SNS96620.1 His Kinase A (phospho-acceptor) domain-containing protein [Granulicella rosea]